MLVRDLRGHSKSRVHRNAHRKRPPVAVVNRAALRSYLEAAFLLAHSARQVVAMSEELQVGEPPENRAHPQERHAGDDEQTNVDAALSHGEFRSANTPVGISETIECSRIGVL